MLSILILNSVFFKDVPTYLYAMNWTHLLVKISVSKEWSWSFNFVLQEIKIHQIFFWWLLPGFPSNWNSKSFMNNNVMNLSNNYENLVTSTTPNNWLKDRLHFCPIQSAFCQPTSQFPFTSRIKIKISCKLFILNNIISLDANRQTI